MIVYKPGTSLNPGNVPDPKTVDVRWVWFDEDPITPRQAGAIHERLVEIGITEGDLGVLLGEGYVSVASLSKWAASWTLRQLDEYRRSTREVELEAEIKSWIANRFRERQPDLRVVVVDD